MLLKQPRNVPIHGGKYRLAYTYRYYGDGYTIIVPVGTITDGASVPRCLWSISGIMPDGLIRAGALLHDYLYGNGGIVPGCTKRFSRKEADLLFYHVNREAGCSWWTSIRAYRAVRWFGWMGAWKKAKEGQNDEMDKPCSDAAVPRAD